MVEHFFHRKNGTFGTENNDCVKFVYQATKL